MIGILSLLGGTFSTVPRKEGLPPKAGGFAEPLFLLQHVLVLLVGRRKAARIVEPVRHGIARRPRLVRGLEAFENFLGRRLPAVPVHRSRAPRPPGLTDPGRKRVPGAVKRDGRQKTWMAPRQGIRRVAVMMRLSKKYG